MRYLNVCAFTCFSLVFGCASSDPEIPPKKDSDDTEVPGSGGQLNVDEPPDVIIPGDSGPTDERPIPNCESDCLDFPEEPIFHSDGDNSPPANAPELFGDPDNMDSSGPCVQEPTLASGDQPGAYFPANWLRPRFRFEPLEDEDLWEIRLQADRERHDLVVYTTSTTWAMPDEIWKAVAQNVHDEPIRVIVRGLNSAAGGTPSGSSGSFMIAPVYARGSMVYWATTSPDVNPNTSKLVGFRVGDEGVVDTLTVTDVGNRQVIGVNGDALRVTPDPDAVSEPGHVQCIGCHVSTPDGKAVAFVDVWPWNNLLASIEEDAAGTLPDYVTSGAERLLNQPWLGMPTFSPAFWDDASKILVTSYSQRLIGDDPGYGFSIDSQGNSTLAWFDLLTTTDITWTAGQAANLNNQIDAARGTAWNVLTLTGETRSALTPVWSHDGEWIAYTSADSEQDGRIGANNDEVDLHRVPFGDGNGGQVTPIAGASESNVAEYYPAISANDRFIAFNRVAPIDNQAMYYRPEGEIWVVPSEGGDAIRLAANDPPACTNESSPGVINSWAKWSPSVYSLDGKNYYWLIFSSARAYREQFDIPSGPFSPPDTRASQLYMAGFVEDEETGEVTTYGAVYLWNQDPNTSNLTPAWDEFKIPPVPPVR